MNSRSASRGVLLHVSRSGFLDEGVDLRIELCLIHDVDVHLFWWAQSRSPGKTTLGVHDRGTTLAELREDARRPLDRVEHRRTVPVAVARWPTVEELRVDDSHRVLGGCRGAERGAYLRIDAGKPVDPGDGSRPTL